MHNKKGQEGTAIAVVLIVIALFMVLYILFISPEERAKILEPQTVDQQSTTSTTNAQVELLAVSPGVLSPSKDFGSSHPIPSMNLFVKTEPNLDTLAQNLVIKSGLFSSSSPVLKFKTDDVKNTKSVALNFFVDKTSGGELRIKLNGRTVYSEVLDLGAQVIELDSNLLQSENELELSTSGPGILFWQTNSINLKNILLKQEFERTNAKEDRSFTLSPGEKSTLSKATLSYTQVCNARLEKQTALLDINVNGRRAESLRIVCVTTQQQFEIDTSFFQEGQNTLSMNLEEGDFSFNQINLLTQTSETKFQTYQFSVPTKEFNKVKSGDRVVKLDLFFLQENKAKNARLDINNNEVLVNTNDNSFSRDITDLVVSGTNFLRIIPSNTITINNLKVSLE